MKNPPKTPKQFLSTVLTADELVRIMCFYLVDVPLPQMKNSQAGDTRSVPRILTELCWRGAAVNVGVPPPEVVMDAIILSPRFPWCALLWRDAGARRWS